MKKITALISFWLICYLASAQPYSANISLGYQGLVMVNNGKIQNTKASKYFTNSVNNDAFYFQGLVIDISDYNEWKYWGISYNWNGTTVNNRNKIIRPTDFFINRLRINAVAFDFGINLTRKRTLLTAGIGLGSNVYKEKPWRYERTFFEVENTILRSEYTFTKMKVQKERVYDLRIFLNLLIGFNSSNERNNTLKLKPILIIPFQKDFFSPSAYFFGANLSLGVQNRNNKRYLKN